MNRKYGFLVFGLTLALSYGSHAFAAEDSWDAMNNYEPVVPQKGSFTQENPVASRILSAPVRAVATVGGTALGSLWGMGKGIAYAEHMVSKNTFERVHDEKDAMLGPVGLAGSILAVPIGAVNGAARGAAQGGISGWMAPEAY